MSSRSHSSKITNNENRNYFSPSDQRMVGFKKFIRRYESKSIVCLSVIKIKVFYNVIVNQTFAKKLLGLDGYEIVFICDDSGSMNTPLGIIFLFFFLFINY